MLFPDAIKLIITTTIYIWIICFVRFGNTKLMHLWLHCLSWTKITRIGMSHAMVKWNTKETMVVGPIWPLADTFDLFSEISRKLHIRLVSTYIFLNSSGHSLSNEMQQAYILTNSKENRRCITSDDVINMFWAVQREPLGV